MPTNNKLVARGTKMIMDEAKVTANKAAELLKKYGNVRKAVDSLKI
jgi:N-acetylmuramic acid 6-phosphate etherase